MNRCFEKEAQFNSNNRINRTSTAQVPKRHRNPLGRILVRSSALFDAVVPARVRSILRASAIVILLILLVGVVGAMERGTLPFGLGMLLGLGMIGIEYCCLCPRKEEREEDEEETEEA